MATSTTDICNRALLRIGAEAIQDINATNPNTNERLCKAHFQSVFNSFVVDVKPTASIQRQQLVQSGKAPLYGYQYAYILPTIPAMLQLLTFNDIDVNNVEYQNYVIEDNILLTNEVSVLISYIKQLTDVSKLQPLQNDALVSRLAYTLAPIIKPDDLNLQQLLQSEYKLNKSKAEFNDSIQQRKPIQNKILNSAYIAAKLAKR